MKLRIDIITIIITCTSLLNCSIIQEGPGKTIRTLFEGGEIIPARGAKIFIHNFTSDDNISFNTKELIIRLKRSINGESRLTVTDIIDEAEIILHGNISSYTVQPVVFNHQGRPELQRLRITLFLTLYNSSTAQIIFQNRTVEAMHEFSDTKIPVETEFRAQLNLIDKIVPRIISQLYTGWYTEELTPAERGKIK
jgi:hypothetical protein